MRMSGSVVLLNILYPHLDHIYYILLTGGQQCMVKNLGPRAVVLQDTHIYS